MSKKKPVRIHRFQMPRPASHTASFTDEEARVLEKDFIDAYSSSKSTLKILMIMYKRYPWQLFLSLVFYVIATLPHISIPIITANLINVVVKVVEAGGVIAQPYMNEILINVGVLVVLLLLNIPTNVMRIKLQS